MLRIFLLSILVSFVSWMNAHAITTWDPFDEMVNRSQNSLIKNQVNRMQDERSDDWPPEQKTQWDEGKDGYTGEVNIQIPSDADTTNIKTYYENGILKLEIPKKKLKSII